MYIIRIFLKRTASRRDNVNPPKETDSLYNESLNGRCVLIIVTGITLFRCVMNNTGFCCILRPPVTIYGYKNIAWNGGMQILVLRICYVNIGLNCVQIDRFYCNISYSVWFNYIGTKNTIQ